MVGISVGNAIPASKIWLEITFQNEKNSKVPIFGLWKIGCSLRYWYSLYLSESAFDVMFSKFQQHFYNQNIHTYRQCFCILIKEIVCVCYGYVYKMVMEAGTVKGDGYKEESCMW